MTDAPPSPRAPSHTDADPSARWSSLLARARAAGEFGPLCALAREAGELKEQHGFPAEHTAVRAALLAGASSQLLQGPLELALLCEGLAPALHVAPFDQIEAELLNEASDTSRFGPELVILVNTTARIPRWPEPGDSLRRARELAEEVCAWYLDPCRRFRERAGSAFVLNTFAPPVGRPSGNLGAKLPGDRTSFVRRVNVLLGDLAPEYVHLNDVAALVEEQGREHWPDLPYWYHARQPVSFQALPEYVRNTAAIAGACFGRSRRCLVLDLDGTLWGGVVADDGLEGIRLGEGDAAGEAFKAFQQHAKELRRRGVLLAVCSKNEPATARLPFERHPESVLTLEDFAAFEAGWGRKPDSLRAIARKLNLGLDALVFFDDNPAEREEVRRALPQVAVPEVPDEPAQYVRHLDAGRWFEAVALSAEDFERTEMYHLRTAADDLRESSSSVEEFLASLEMRAVLAPFEAASIERIAQLVNKTNQFNLTTRRSTPAEVAARGEDPGWVTRSVRLADRFGRHGLVSAVCARKRDDALEIDTWVMSCRVMGRGVEGLILEDLVEAARELGLTSIRGTYVPSPRNAPVERHYPGLGFQPEDAPASAPEGATSWVLPVAGFVPSPPPIARVEVL